MWNDVLTLFREYMGTGLIVSWFLIALIYLFIKEKRKPLRILFIYVPVILLLLFFNPLFAGIVYAAADAEVYYRILWLIPMTPVLAYSIVCIISELAGIKRWLFGVLSLILIMISGKYVYSNPYFHPAENMYHVPQAVVDICEAIEVEGREVRAIFPVELLQYVRQYSPVVCMPYGRDIIVSKWIVHNELYDVMESEEIDAQAIAAGCRAQEVVYIVLPEDKKVKGNLADYDFDYFASVDGYVIYKDATVNLTYFLEEGV